MNEAKKNIQNIGKLPGNLYFFVIKFNNTKTVLAYEEYDFNQHYLMSDALQF